MDSQRWGELLITGGFVGLVTSVLMMTLAGVVIFLGRRNWVDVPDVEVEEPI